ncbi:hypothetical protein RHGRI_016526 [Rhododendron griersonianum]|uniref:F-box associated beta-propeller type 1 domain-containing protein n=1 Tax=Rhododendron griersonianum TaxID=479676 RepID=A0AAV6JUH0_9ERIC|nr:hypothetical protein RHGRI_016526 [Rhododendron griersonianum]
MVGLHYPRRKKEIGGTEEVEMPQFEILGSCKGLLLIKHDIDFYLWNPLTRQCTKVLSYPRSDERFEYDRVLTSSRLCYDSVTDEYKHFNGDKGIAVAACLKSKHWTNVYFPYKLKSGDSGLVVNERLHWVVKRDGDGMRSSTQLIVCFDPLVDEFVEFSTPLPYYGERNVILGLGILYGCLSVARYYYFERSYGPDDDPNPNIEVLIMKEYGVEESWTSLFVISHFVGLYKFYSYKPHIYGCLVPLGLTKSGKSLWQ